MLLEMSQSVSIFLVFLGYLVTKYLIATTEAVYIYEYSIMLLNVTRIKIVKLNPSRDVIRVLIKH